jgi:ribosomal protein S18 acetylase RimI-like enzyme
MSPVTFRRMIQDDLASVSALGIRSKASWEYNADEMSEFSQELTLSAKDLDDLLAAQVATSDDVIVGYYTVRKHSDGLAELEHLFVDTDMFHRGIGTQLFRRALEAARLALDLGWAGTDVRPYSALPPLTAIQEFDLVALIGQDKV